MADIQRHFTEEIEVYEHEPEPEKEQTEEDEKMELWCLIVGMIGTAFPVLVKATDRVWELQKMIRNEAAEIYGDLNAAQIQLFLAKKDNGEWLTATEVQDIENGNIESALSLLDRGHLISMSRLADSFTNRDVNAVHVLVPAPSMTSDVHVEMGIGCKRKRLKQSIGDVETMPVFTEELEMLFDVLGQHKPNEEQVISTRALSKFCKRLGGFPVSYFVRKEELMLWRLVLGVMSNKGKRVVILGSAGVGKSCFLMLVSVYLAFVEKRKVLVIRRLKKNAEASAVIFLNGENKTCIRNANLSAAKISSLPDNKDFQDALICVDGYSHQEVDHHFGLLSFQLLLTSEKDKITSDDSTCEMMLPGWRYDDLLQYAQSTLDAWKKTTGLDQEKQNDTADLVKDQYFYSGGSLRNFCRSRKDMKNELNGMCDIVKRMHTVDWEDVDPQRIASFDQMQRWYVVDPSDEKHYCLSSYWKAQMDSGYVFDQIGRFIAWEKDLDYYQFAQQTRAGYWGSIYKQYFHASVRRSTQKSPLQMVNVVVNSNPSYSNQKYDRIEICGQVIECEGATEEECYEHLSALSSRTCWHPDGVNFFPIDAVVMCDAVLRGSNVSETILAVICTTVSTTTTFDPNFWKRFNRVLDDNERISRAIPRAFVVTGPDASTCKRFSLINAPVSDDFMVCCYDPLKFFRKRPNARIA
ncbi:unnamed protein product [Peronospora farinosa]|uniref:Crinkler effector protein N-terminal domain-containing protein n=1 Tax=Peronospora farinosa TaxID=134698 RepID=A0AAV0U5Q1_9STRA|nr:unnamed protein product [Peronospora farinosa]CAI5730284.1 unnamed protein product [Peronospora farinosa]